MPDLKICITGASGRISHALIPLLLSPSTFKDDIQIDLSLLDVDIEICIAGLKGLSLELEDCNYPTLKKVSYSTNPNEAFKDCDLIIFLGGSPRLPGMERSDLLKANGDIYKVQGTALQNAKPNVKCIVIANPCNTNCKILYDYAKKVIPNIPKENFTCLTRLDQNRTEGLYKSINNKSINGVIIGNHSNSMVVDNVNGEVFSEEFIKKIQNRGTEILNVKKMSSTFSAAKAISDHVRDWYYGNEKLCSSGVIIEDNNLNIKKGLCVSFPVKFKGNWDFDIQFNVVEDFYKDQSKKEKLDKTFNELKDESEIFDKSQEGK